MTNLSQLYLATLHRMEREILDDVLAKRVPPTCASFSELHDYVDANAYGGFCDDANLDELVQQFGGRNTDEGLPEGLVDFINNLQNDINRWLHFGCLKRLMHFQNHS